MLGFSFKIESSMDWIEDEEMHYRRGNMLLEKHGTILGLLGIFHNFVNDWDYYHHICLQMHHLIKELFSNTICYIFR